MFMYISVFEVIPGLSFWGSKTHINKIPRKIPGQSGESSVYVCFFSSVHFFAANKTVNGEIVL